MVLAAKAFLKAAPKSSPSVCPANTLLPSSSVSYNTLPFMRLMASPVTPAMPVVADMAALPAKSPATLVATFAARYFFALSLTTFFPNLFSAYLVSIACADVPAAEAGLRHISIMKGMLSAVICPAL